MSDGSAAMWHPVANADEVPARHLFHGRLSGRELVLWRDGAGAVHAWENRCPHRGVRLSIGTHCGDRIRCRYHAMEFDAAGTCVHVPAHPHAPIPGRLRAHAHACAEAHGFIWTCLDAADGTPALPEGTPANAGLTLRPMPVRAGTQIVMDALAASATRLLRRDTHSLLVELQAGGECSVLFMLQPTGDAKCIIRGLHCGTLEVADTVRRELNAHLRALRDELEAALPLPRRDTALWSLEPRS